MFGSKIEIDADLLEKAKLYAKNLGYSSVGKFVEHLLEKEMAKDDSEDSEEEVKKRLRGLGYI